MAREAMVTRTFKTSVATVLCLDVENAQPIVATAILPREYKDEKSLMKATKAALETETLKVVKVKGIEPKETLYGMPESEFIAHAKVITRGKTETEE